MIRTAGIILARGGSKSVPNKNIVMVGSRPLIAWTIEAACAARCLDRLVVSTDSPAIADVAIQYGAEVPFMRPAELAQDDTPSVDAVVHAVKWLEENEHYSPDYIMLLQVTSPLRTAADIRAAITLAEAHDAVGVISVCPVKQHPYWTKKITEDGRLVDFVPMGQMPLRRQDLPPAYAFNGAVYLVKREVLLRQHSLHNEDSLAYVMPRERSMDIDSLDDLRIAGVLLEEMIARGENQTLSS